MQVVLVEPVRKLGNVGDVVKVRDGFARNFLIPQKKALRATKENLVMFEQRKAEIEKENEKKLSAAEKFAKKINESFAVLVRQAAEDGRLYGSVTSQDIAKAFSRNDSSRSDSSKNDSSRGDVELDRKQVPMNQPIKYIGIYTMEVVLHGDVTAKIFVNVSRSESEAEDAEARFKRGEVVMEGPVGEEAARAKSALAAIEVPLVEAPLVEAPLAKEESTEEATEEAKS